MAKLEWFYGCMNCGKTNTLLQVDFNYRSLGYNPLIIKPQIDTRDGKQENWGTIKSRLIDENRKCLYLNSIDEEFLHYIKSTKFDVVLVDEAQFFKNSDITMLSNLVDYLNIPVLCYGLKTDSNGNLFEGAKTLFAISDTCRELKQICKCGKKAIMHLRLVNGKPILGNSIQIDDGSVEYVAVCRKCWKKAFALATNSNFLKF